MLRRRLRLRALSAAHATVAAPEDLEPIAAELARHLQAGDVVHLDGPIGVGKTTFAQYLGRALGVRDDITSPTYTLVHRYSGSVPVTHIDLYRLDAGDTRSLIEIGEEIEPESIALVEWPAHGAGILPAASWTVHLTFGAEGSRRVEVSPAVGG